MPAATTMYPFTCCAFLISFPVALVANPGIDDASHRLSLPAEIQCLIWQGDENGCGAIRNKELCLRSVDGRPWRQWRGHKIYGQPCAWCDGDNCTANDDKVCMPADWVKDQPWVTVANCSRPSDRTVIERVPQVQAAAAAAGSVGLQDAGHPDFACGAPHAAASSMANNFFYTFTAGSLDQCKLLCSSKKYCQGLEYQARDGVCMLWWNTIQSMEPKLGHTCAPTRSGQEDCQACTSSCARDFDGASSHAAATPAASSWPWMASSRPLLPVPRPRPARTRRPPAPCWCQLARRRRRLPHGRRRRARRRRPCTWTTPAGLCRAPAPWTCAARSPRPWPVSSMPTRLLQRPSTRR
ncbi:unnamed protein product [Prorocentrum cordatum]|uniref:Apple domain-containing protein n=1 Tax=Prorocentrum cordatum TaxID=2364126 RepID=A0ABN9VFH8_9DINO|nr:unnamed protein product [Polarella glacialis]